MVVNAFETIKRSGAALQNIQFCKVCVVSLRVENCETEKTNVWGSVKAITVETNGLTPFGSDGARSQPRQKPSRFLPQEPITFSGQESPTSAEIQCRKPYLVYE